MSARVYDRLEGSGAAKYLVPVYDMGILPEYEGRGFIVMGLVRGAGSTPQECLAPKTMAELIANWHATGTANFTENMRRICEAVGALHEQNIIHRDLKPDNILFSEGGQVRLIDLGLAAELGPDGYAHGGAGTHSYMAPETGLESRSNRASDVYSLGLIAYELLAGKNPFEHLTPPGTVPAEHHCEWIQREKAAATILKPSEYGRYVKAWQDDLVLLCLSANAKTRPQSATELRELIEAQGRSGAAVRAAGWKDWIAGPRNWSEEAGAIQLILDQWGNKPRDEVWFDAATKLAVCRLSMTPPDARRAEILLKEAEDLVLRGIGVQDYADRAAWYGELASVMENVGRLDLRRSAFRDSQEKALMNIGISRTLTS
ncbi:MAG: serine/threonine-protein kinase [Candidatus Solibacter sp.]|nr:serine/threonine-protein kinase [Candidatus Solibacter sp.]